jgi:regulator of sirC expression with transglutaminase-like and TPR domain
MGNPKQLPYLIKLLDDDSPIVQESVLKELASFGPSLHRELSRMNIAISDDQQQKMHSLLEEYNRKWLLEQWPVVLEMKEEKEQLEVAMELIAEFQYGRGYPVKLATLLDGLTEEFRLTSKKQDALGLAHFLFRVKQLKGAESDYYNPINSNLVYVIEEKRGIPISLACVYLLVAHRLHFDVEGINMPGHFLARAIKGKQSYVIDCFNGGRILAENEAVSWNNGPPVPITDLLKLECTPLVILTRALRNLANAYKQEQSEENSQLMTKLFQMMDEPGDETGA